MNPISSLLSFVRSLLAAERLPEDPPEPAAAPVPSRPGFLRRLLAAEELPFDPEPETGSAPAPRVGLRWLFAGEVLAETAAVPETDEGFTGVTLGWLLTGETLGHDDDDKTHS